MDQFGRLVLSTLKVSSSQVKAGRRMWDEETARLPCDLHRDSKDASLSKNDVRPNVDKDGQK